MKTYQTKKGTELPLLNLRGREYLEVKYRLVWFREEHPDWAIETDLLSVNENSAYARAAIKDASGRTIATSHKFESRKGFPDFIEKAETGAIGRALALIGYGTQFCADELDEGERIVDAPVDVPRSLMAAKGTAPEKATAKSTSVGADPGGYQIQFGKKYKGVQLRDISRNELEGYIEWLEDNANKKGMPLSEEVKTLKAAVGRYLTAVKEKSESAKPSAKH